MIDGGLIGVIGGALLLGVLWVLSTHDFTTRR